MQISTEARIVRLEAQQESNAALQKTLVSDLQTLRKQLSRIEIAIATLKATVEAANATQALNQQAYEDRISLLDSHVEQLRLFNRKLPWLLIGACGTSVTIFTGLLKIITDMLGKM